ARGGGAPARVAGSTGPRVPPSGGRGRAATSSPRAAWPGPPAARPRWRSRPAARERGAAPCSPPPEPAPGAPRSGPALASQTGVARVRGAAEGLDLAPQAFDLRRLLRALEGVSVDPQRRGALAESLVGVTQVLNDGGVIPRQLDGALELLDRALVLAALVVHPPQAVDVDAVVRLQLEGTADEALGLVELHPHVRQRVPEVVERGGVTRVELDRLAHLRDGPLLVVGLVVRGAEREAVAIVVRRARHDLLEERDGAIVPLFLAVDGRQVGHQLDAFGVHLERLLETADGLGGIVLLEQVR